MHLPAGRAEKIIIAIISFAFIAWSAAFIYGSSFIAVNGSRYFCLFDDAMISMRYAWNFSHGNGLVWNPGQYVEGYTNLLMTLLMSAATFVFDKSAAVLFIQICGVGFMLAIAGASTRVSDHIGRGQGYQRRGLVRVIVFACTLFYYPLMYWSLMGMETGLLALLLVMGVLSALNYDHDRSPSALARAAVFLGLAYLTRNDSLVFAMLVWAFLGWGILARRGGWAGTRHLRWAVAMYMLVVAGQFLFQRVYYGQVMPNTYTLKLTGLPLLARLSDGAIFVEPFINVTAPILILSVIDLLADFQRPKLLLMSIIWAALGYQVYVGGDPWNYWRIMSPTMPLLIVLFVSAVYAVVHAAVNARAVQAVYLRNPIIPRQYITEILVAPISLLVLLTLNTPFWPEMSLSIRPYLTDCNEMNVNAAVVLDELTTPDATIGVLWAGTIPYYTGRESIDFLGKCDKYIATLPPDVSGKAGWGRMKSIPGHNKYDLDYSIGVLKPTYVQCLAWGGQDISDWAASRYVKLRHEGVRLLLLKDSPAVIWGKTAAPSSAPAGDLALTTQPNSIE